MTGKKRGGRKKGVPNKFTQDLRDLILGAMNAAHPKGALAYLTARANDTPGPFLALVGKVLPIVGTGPQGEIVITWQK
jgi:hypothetical protein